MDLDLRKLRYFVAVAEQLNFGRAAKRLDIAQPVLSRQISRLEDELEMRLFTRTSRQVALTDRGRLLLDEARTLLAAADAAQRRLNAGRDRTLTIGFMAGIPVTAAMGAFTEAHPDVTVELRRIEWYDQAELILDGTVDIAYVRLPIDERGLRVRPLYAEPRLAVLWTDHPLAGQRSLSIRDLADDPVIMHDNAMPAWDAFCNTDPRPDGRRPRPGPAIRTMEEKLEYVAAGRAITFLPASAAAYYHRPDIVCVPITDIPPHPVGLAHAAHNHAETVEAFVHAATSTSPTPKPD